MKKLYIAMVATVCSTFYIMTSVSNNDEYLVSIDGRIIIEAQNDS